MTEQKREQKKGKYNLPPKVKKAFEDSLKKNDKVLKELTDILSRYSLNCVEEVVNRVD